MSAARMPTLRNPRSMGQPVRGNRQLWQSWASPPWGNRFCGDSCGKAGPAALCQPPAAFVVDPCVKGGPAPDLRHSGSVCIVGISRPFPKSPSCFLWRHRRSRFCDLKGNVNLAVTCHGVNRFQVEMIHLCHAVPIILEEKVLQVIEVILRHHNLTGSRVKSHSRSGAELWICKEPDFGTVCTLFHNRESFSKSLLQQTQAKTPITKGIPMEPEPEHVLSGMTNDFNFDREERMMVHRPVPSGHLKWRL